MNKVELVRNPSGDRTAILVNGRNLGCIEGSGRGNGMIYILVSKDSAKDFDYWSNAVPVARFKYGKGKGVKARAWVNGVMSHYNLDDMKAQLASMSPLALLESRGVRAWGLSA